MLALTQRLVINPEVAMRDLGEGGVVVHFGRDELFTLSATAARFWELAAPHRPLAEIVEILLREFDVGREVVEQEVLDLTRRLVSAGLAEIVAA